MRAAECRPPDGTRVHQPPLGSAPTPGARASGADEVGGDADALLPGDAHAAAGRAVGRVGAGRALGAGPEAGDLALAARLHDVGKLAIPLSILHKPDALTATEMEWVRQHPVLGERLVARILPRREVLAGIRSHHERPDGRGYPDQLQGDEVPLLARIIAIADCYDALTSARAYHHPRPRREALEILSAEAGSQFDAALVRLFLTLLR